MEGTQSSVSDQSRKYQQWDREKVAEHLAQYDLGEERSQRELSVEWEVPRSTLQHWLSRKDSLDLDPELARFVESPTGVAFLHRLTLAAHLMFTQVGPCGIRLLCEFLELSHLDRVVASSFGAQQQTSVEIQKAIIEFGQQERVRLAQDMPSKQITVCEDETFHPQICLVAMEPVSNFIILEIYADNRTAETWNQQMVLALHGLPVEVVQATSDEGQSLIAHARDSLGAHHSPDLFHVQQELSRATSAPLARPVAKAEAELQRQREATQAMQGQRDACRDKCPEATANLQLQVEQLKIAESKAEENLKDCEARQEQARAAILGIGEDYHPIDPFTGELNDPDHVTAHLNAHFNSLEKIADEVNLSSSCKKRIAKARRVLALMISTIAFYWKMVVAKIDSLPLDAIQQAAVYQELLPARYLELVAKKASTAEIRKQIGDVADQFLARARDGPLAQLAPEQWQQVDAMAIESAQLFQRSSSCVEGRNGQLALRHHSFHQLRPQKLTALTTLHNYFIRRPDGTTATERFFGSKPRDLFDWLLDRIPVPARPAARRSKR